MCSMCAQNQKRSPNYLNFHEEYSNISHLRQHCTLSEDSQSHSCPLDRYFPLLAQSPVSFRQLQRKGKSATCCCVCKSHHFLRLQHSPWLSHCSQPLHTEYGGHHQEDLISCLLHTLYLRSWIETQSLQMPGLSSLSPFDCHWVWPWVTLHQAHAECHTRFGVLEWQTWLGF